MVVSLRGAEQRNGSHKAYAHEIGNEVHDQHEPIDKDGVEDCESGYLETEEYIRLHDGAKEHNKELREPNAK